MLSFDLVARWERLSRRSGQRSMSSYSKLAPRLASTNGGNPEASFRLTVSGPRRLCVA
jgi:hypothetical protein